MTAEPGEPSGTNVAPDDPRAKPKRPLGLPREPTEIPGDFDTMGQEEIIRLFEGEAE